MLGRVTKYTRPLDETSLERKTTYNDTCLNHNLVVTVGVAVTMAMFCLAGREQNLSNSHENSRTVTHNGSTFNQGLKMSSSSTATSAPSSSSLSSV